MQIKEYENTINLNLKKEIENYKQQNQKLVQENEDLKRNQKKLSK